MTKKLRKGCPKDSDTYHPGTKRLRITDRLKNRIMRGMYNRGTVSFDLTGVGLFSNTLAREKHRVRMAKSRKATKDLKRSVAKGYIQRRLSTPSWGNLELAPRSEMHTEPRADCNTIYLARSQERLAVEETIAIDALVALSLNRTQHVAQEWIRPASDSVMERAMALTSSSPMSPPASLRPAAGNAANAGAENAG
ncbi:hypothetical protein B0H16DRAFT_1805288 [Mycena metata]|uniref:Uncharacterized protein n=1 Tax=Mycena metata TaxID=1033252 RepID=A0AAD7H9W6_9AGAR|nr:hypothetical protein B0H16DRAFT_1805288 [Mycena metata]